MFSIGTRESEEEQAALDNNKIYGRIWFWFPFGSISMEIDYKWN